MKKKSKPTGGKVNSRGENPERLAIKEAAKEAFQLLNADGFLKSNFKPILLRLERTHEEMEEEGVGSNDSHWEYVRRVRSLLDGVCALPTTPIQLRQARERVADWVPEKPGMGLAISALIVLTIRGRKRSRRFRDSARLQAWEGIEAKVNRLIDEITETVSASSIVGKLPEHSPYLTANNNQ